MLKRADSVSKRWSQTSGAGFARSGSTASNRNSYMGGYGGGVQVTDRASSTLSTSRDNSLEPSSRPTSSHSNLTVTQKSNDKTPEKDDDGFVKPSLPSRAHSRSKSVASLRSLSNEQSGLEPGSPASPSKRWSPTKSSWLESALTKEEKPKITTQAPPAQPSWMAEINKAKQQRAASPTKEISSPFASEAKGSPFGRDNLKSAAKPVSSPEPIKIQRTGSPTKDLVNRFSAEVKSPPVVEPLKSTSSRSPASKNELSTTATIDPSPPEVSTAKPPPPEPSKAKSPPPELAAKPIVTPKDKPDIPAKLTSPPPSSSITAARKNMFEQKAAPAASSTNAPGKFDFRSQLKSRAPPPDGSKSTEPEFKNAIGNLKRAKTQNYVAPDTLKDNIMRGKGALNITGGVPERKRVDELKEQLNAQKAQIQKRKESGEVPVRPQKPKEMEAVPEGLARRKTLTRSGSQNEGVGMVRGREETPEAVAALRGLVGKKNPPPVKEKRISSGSSTNGPSMMGSAKEGPEPSKPEPAPSQPSNELTKSRSAPSPPVGLPGMIKPGVSNKLADRFNPALANMLARGPPGSGSASKTASPGESPALSRVTTQDEVKPGPELEHKTKGRARGPQRRAKGKGAATAATPSATEEAKEEPKPEFKTEPARPSSVSKPAVSTPVKHGRVPSVQLVRQKDVLSSSPADKGEAASAISKPAISTPSKHGRVPSAQLVSPKDVLKSSPAVSPASAHARPESLEAKAKPITPSKSPSLSGTSTKSEVETKTQSTPGRLPLREHPGNNATPKTVESPSPTKTRALPTPPTESPKKDSSKAAVGALFERRFQQGPPAKKTVEALAPDVEPEKLEEASEPALKAKPSKIETPKKETPAKSAIGALFEQRFISTPPSRSGNNSPTPATEDSMAPMSVRDSTALFARQESPGPFSSGRRSPIKLPTKHDEEKAMRDAGLMPPPESKPSTTGLGISAAPTAQSSTVEVIRGGKSPLSPPLSVRASPLNGSHGPKTPGESPKPALPAESPIPHTSEATRLFGDFFDERPVAAKGEIDTLSVLESSPLPTEKATTMKKQIQEITSDGKMVAVPSHQEHMLFDQSMYVCTHTFSTARGAKSTEVYLWAGSDVSPAALEDAQLFSRRVARDNNGKLIVIQQGQETPYFLQAIGGILITFKGSKSRNSIGVPPKFIICGRRHLGHIVFDEVDFTLHSFCSGFPYLISHSNRLYLWKGIGCHQEELSSARLITMDVSPTPDLTEIEEGKEPASFFALFPPLPKYPKNTIPRSADHWRLRPRHENYAVRLFEVQQARTEQKSISLQVSSFFSNVIKRRPSWSSFGGGGSQPATPTSGLPPDTTTPTPTLLSPAAYFNREPSPTNFEQPRTPSAFGGDVSTKIVEISPFGQGDLKAEGVFVLDAFFEVYM